MHKDRPLSLNCISRKYEVNSQNYWTNVFEKAVVLLAGNHLSL